MVKQYFGFPDPGVYCRRDPKSGRWFVILQDGTASWKTFDRREDAEAYAVEYRKQLEARRAKRVQKRERNYRRGR